MNTGTATVGCRSRAASTLLPCLLGVPQLPREGPGRSVRSSVSGGGKEEIGEQADAAGLLKHRSSRLGQVRMGLDRPSNDLFQASVKLDDRSNAHRACRRFRQQNSSQFPLCSAHCLHPVSAFTLAAPMHCPSARFLSSAGPCASVSPLVRSAGILATCGRIFTLEAPRPWPNLVSSI